MAQTFTLQVVNSHATLTRSFILGQGLKTEQGILKDGAFDGVEDTPDAAKLSATGSPQTVEMLLNFLKNNPARTRSIKFKSTAEGQTDVSLVYKHESPFRNMGDEIISLAKFTNENTVNGKIVTMNQPLQFDDQSKLIVPVEADSTLTMTIEFDQVLNGAEAAQQVFAK